MSAEAEGFQGRVEEFKNKKKPGIAKAHKDNTNKVISDNISPDRVREETFTKSKGGEKIF